MMRLDAIDTPYLLLDEARMLRNIARVNDQAAALGVGVRPHVKSCKSVEIVQRMMTPASPGVTISTLREAEFFARHGVRDFLLTTPMAPAKAARVAALPAGVRFTTIVDRAASLVALDAAARQANIRLNLLLELTCDDHRGGARLDGPEMAPLLDAARAAQASDVRGVMVYPGASMDTVSAGARADLAERHRRLAIDGAAVAVAHGLSDDIRSFGSTSVLMAARSLDGITEHRGGMYVFQDVQQVGIGWCTRDDIALIVVATVVGHSERRNLLFIDAGGLALSKDRSTAGTALDAGYGLVVDPVSQEPYDDLYVSDVHQEHGMVTRMAGAPIDFTKYPIGTLVAIQPNHADMTAAAYERYHVLRSGAIAELWSRENGW